eukprot:438743-Prymnesium_polylepis.1
MIATGLPKDYHRIAIGLLIRLPPPLTDGRDLHLDLLYPLRRALAPNRVDAAARCLRRRTLPAGLEPWLLCSHRGFNRGCCIHTSFEAV